MTESVDARIRANRGRFDELVTMVELRDARGDLEAAAVHAQLAAALAWHSPTGLFASPRLEACLRSLSTALPVGMGSPSRRGDGVGAVLHVLTTAYGVGGHTRLAWRWIDRDDRRVHSVAVTRQGIEPIPAGLTESVRARGGQVHRIDRAASSLSDRAIALSGLISQADIVVLHAHPFDPVPLLALAALDRLGVRPATILLNHADHVFWIGSSVSDLILHLRSSGARLSESRRGLPTDRSAILPLPLPLGHDRQPQDRTATRSALGFEAGDVVAISIASGYKFGAAGDPRRLLPILQRAIAGRPRLRVLAVGPGGRADWARAERATAGRIRALGNLNDLAPVYAAADIYLDSHPFSSLTSMLEAGQHGLPLLSLSDPDPDLDVLAFDDPATDGLPIRARAVEDYLGELGHLVDDRARRIEHGQRVADALEMHVGPTWQRHLEQAYERAIELHALHRPLMATDDPPHGSVTELDRRLMTLLDAQQGDAPRGVRGHLRLAPFSIRLEEWRRYRHSDRPLSVLVLLPEDVLMRARRVGILARGLLRRARAVRGNAGQHRRQ